MQPVVEELRHISAWQACRRLASLPHVLFLDSAQRTPQSRFSFVTADPFEWLTARGKSVVRNGRSLDGKNPFEVLKGLLAEFSIESISGLPPFQGGAAGLFGYELCHHLERLPRPRWDDFAMPDLAVGFYDWTIAFDHETSHAWIVSTGLPETEPRRRRRRAEQRISFVKDALLRQAMPRWQPQRPITLATPQFPLLDNVTTDFRREEYLATVRRAIEYIHAGDCFQVNLAQRLLTPANLPPLELYARLRDRNPAPFAGYFDLGDFTLASASPERFLRVLHGEVETRPIKGTRPRGKTPAEDRAHAEELLHSAKDRAENVMIVDLLRNDLGRVCKFGSVHVGALCRLESFQYVHHLVSEVRGELRNGMGPVDLLQAAFPGGSITGAPKIRAMEIIAELEPCTRGAYCGSLGYVGFDGSMDTNLLIRTFTIGKGWIQFPVGGGIVADSDPQREYEETFHKAEGLLRALRQ